MENVIYDISKEYRDIVEEVSKKYHYSEDLKHVLNKILPVMLENRSCEDRMTFYNMLRVTPIVVVAEGSNVTTKDLKDQYIGDINSHIQEEEVDIGEYGRAKAAGFFYSEPILDEKLSIKGSKQFIYITALDTSKSTYTKNDRYQKFQTPINVPHLIHELGHAWSSQDNHYSIEGNILKERAGTATITYQITPLENGTFSKKEISREGLMTEEALNTNMEQASVANYLKMSKEKAKQLYKTGGCLVPSSYMGSMSVLTEHLTEEPIIKNLVEKWRIHGDQKVLESINAFMEKTPTYQNRCVKKSYEDRKKEIFDNPPSPKIASFFKRCRSDFFPEVQDMTSMQMVENALQQCYDVVTNMLAFNMSEEKEKNLYMSLIQSATIDVYGMLADVREQSKEENIDKAK